MKIGFLFAGQGSQHPGMGKDFYEQYDAARRLYDSIDIDIPVKELCFNGTQEQLNDTAVAQPCILATSSAIAAVLSEKGIHADVAAGLSLGEYSALAYAGVQDGFWGYLKSRDRLVETIQAHRYESFSFTVNGVTVTCRVDYSGYAGAGDFLVPLAEEEPSYSFVFSMERAE